ncbi:YbhN family protein [Xenophilus sp. Marseille-Q4582]|uniref:lysylphosphatidylglycerol synthase transmembrane domain-containing protein n=1 Tax=Xenophilus sp. Marseille-Q4582 TaxID=2866600 RepID=UPI001CE471B1|nr:YbhN family protein [Xenophilus sp. Marseille-Q4582]
MTASASRGNDGRVREFGLAPLPAGQRRGEAPHGEGPGGPPIAWRGPPSGPQPGGEGASAPPAHRPLRTRPWWPWARRGAVLVFLLLVAVLLVQQARAVEWAEVFTAMRAYPWAVLAAAAALAALSHGIYATFDLIGRHYTGHRLPAATVMAITFVSYAFNLNMGTIVGAVGMRARLYTRLGLKAATVTRIVGTSMLTNWLGYCLLAGLAFAAWPPVLPEGWHLGGLALRAVGAGMVGLVLAYGAMCAFSTRREFHVRGHAIDLPGWRVALLQLLLSCSNWAVMGAAMFVLLQGQVPYPLALGVLLIGAVAGLLSRVPAGLGVLESVVVALLMGTQGSPSRNALLAAVLCYRAVYYWIPLGVAAVLYLGMEANARKLRAGAAAQAPAADARGRRP